MGVKLQSALGGSVELNAPSTASNFTMTVPAVNGTIATTDQMVSFKNKIINGAMMVAQRGTSSSSGGYKTVDRFFFGWTSGTVTIGQADTKDANVSGTNAGYGSYMTVNASSSVGGYWTQPVEDVNLFSAKTVTFSYYYYVNSGSNTNTTCYLRQNFGTGGSTQVDTTPISDTTYDVSSGSITAKRRVLVFNVPSVSSKTRGPTNTSFTQVIVGWAGTHNISYWGVQMEIGSIATEFEYRPYTLELQMCKRYYQPFGGAGGAASASQIHALCMLPVELRDTPSTVGVYTSGNACVSLNRGTFNLNSVSTWSTTKYSVGLYANSADTGMTPGQIAWVYGYGAYAESEL